MQSIPAERIRQALEAPEGMTEGVQPSIIAHLNIDMSKVAEFTSCYLNHGWAPKIKELLDAGWVAFRIQTEMSMIGYDTKIYFARMKAN